jgi:outer membrane protein TolC
MLIVTLVLCGALVAGPSPAEAADSVRLSVREAVETALRTHPALTAAGAVARAAQERVAQARASRLPRLSADVSATRWDWVMPNKRIYLDSARIDVYGGLSLNYLAFDGGARAARTRLAIGGAEDADLRREELRREITFAVERAYYRLLEAQRLVPVHEASVRNLGEHLRTARLLYAAGTVSQVDVLKAQVQIAVAENDVASARNAVEADRIELAGAMGLEGLGDVVLEDPFEAQPGQPEGPVFGLASWLERLERHPALARAELAIRSRKDETALARSEFFPRVLALGSYTREGSGLLPGHPNWSLGLGLSLPLFDGGARSADRAAARATETAAVATRDALRQHLDAAVRADLVRLEDARRRVGIAAEVVRLAEESLRAATIRYRAGRTPVLDVLDAEDVLLRARTAGVQALTDVALARAALRYDVGADPAR